jgi:membrane-associated protease RseP (regulator of RpoE activity)
VIGRRDPAAGTIFMLTRQSPVERRNVVKRRLVSPWTIALIMALSPVTDSFGQSSPGNPPRQENIGQNTALTLQAIRDAQGQQGNGPWQSNSYSPWHNMVLGYSPHGLNLAWFDATSRNSGMTLAPADPALRAHLNLPKDAGLIVTAIEPGSPAFAAGIRQNDILIRIGEDNFKFGSLGKPQDLEQGLKAVGDQPVPLIVLRGGKRLSLKVQPRVRVSLGPVHPEPPTYWIGVSVTPIEPALRSQLQLPNRQGLIAMEVVEDGPAAKAGLLRYDILLKFDGVDLTDQAGLTKLVQDRGEKTVALDVFREGHKHEVMITPERRKASATHQFQEAQAVQFDFVHPGAVVPGREAAVGHIGDLGSGQFDLMVVNQDAQPLSANRNIVGNQDGPPVGKSTEQRLDELTAQIKKLRQAVEALSRAKEKK